MKTRPLLSTTAAVSALVLCGTTGTAAAGTTSTTTKARGSAASALNLLSVQAGGHTVSVGSLAMSSSTLTGSPVAKIALTPLVADGTSYGAQTITPADGPVTVPSQTSPSPLAGIVSLASPAFTASATDAPSTNAGAGSLGDLSLLGLDVPLAGTIDLGSAVSGTTGALAQKTVEVSDLALPSIADLLGALGLDLSKLPVATLTDLVDQLDLVTSAVDTAQAALTAAAADVDAKTASLTSANATLATATTALNTVLATVDTAAYPAASTLSGYLAIVDKTAVNTGTSGLSTALASYTSASALVATANGLLDAAQAVLDTATTTLVGAVTGVLDGTPLVSLGSLSVSSKAAASSASAGGQVAEIVGGEISGLQVLGTDVLETALGSSTVDVLDLVGSTATTVSSTIADLTGTLSSVLSNVPGLPALSIPAPTVGLLTKTTSTDVAGGFGTALASLTGLRITVPAITLPTALALPGAASLPGLSGVTQVAGSLTSAPLQLDLATLSEQSAFAPAVTTVSSPPGVDTPTTLPKTGLPVGVAVLALVSIGGAFVVRRRAAQQ